MAAPPNAVYNALDGSRWIVEPVDAPRGYEWAGYHVAYDGPGDNRLVYGGSPGAVVDLIEEHIRES